MANADHTSPGSRAGLLQCLCGPLLAPDDPLRGDAIANGPALAAGFSAAVLSQVLSLTTLPLAGLALAGPGLTAGLPLVALFAGGALSTFPAALLGDGFGRRAAAALGTSLGIAGGLVAAYAMVRGEIALLVLGAFWLGIAQGFGLFYRHEALARTSGAGTGALALVFGSGAIAGLLAPSTVAAAEHLGSPYLFAGTLVAAGLCHVASLWSVRQQPTMNEIEGTATPAVRPGGAFLNATLIGALAWLLMARLMAGAPVGLAGCGVAFEATAGIVAWHVVAMYAPALASAWLVGRLGAGRLAALGLGIALAGAALPLVDGDAAWTHAAGLVAVGAGWCLATIGASVMLRQGRASRPFVGLHDAALFCAALAGVVSAQ